jgi:D-beta-D-heptose 7-phosphate kinase/D-beta-D-heptose 1-phosphate adenosyltransferase
MSMALLVDYILNTFRQTYTLVIGDIILDRYVYGNALRVSPEAPVLVLHEAQIEEALGGAGNVAANAASLADIQGHTALICVTGKDPEDIALKKKFGEHVGGPGHFLHVGSSVCTSNVHTPRPTTLKTRYVAHLHNTHLLRADREDTTPIPEAMQTDIISLTEILLNPAKAVQYDSVILSDYGKGVLANGICQKIIREAHARNKIVVVDPKSNDYEKYTGADALTPNVTELRELVGYEFSEDNDEEIAQAATNLMLWTKCNAVLVTRSDKGVLIATQERAQSPGPNNSEVTSFRTTFATIPASARQVVDVSGAGDTAVAAFTMARACGCTWYDAAVIAEAAAGCAVAVRGTARVGRDSLRVALAGAFQRVRDQQEGVRFAAGTHGLSCGHGYL